MRRFLLLFVFLMGGSFFLPQSVQAAVCSISSNTVVNQTYVTDNACTSIIIEGNVSTTWIGTVDLGGGTVTVKTGYTMTMGTNSEMILGAADDFVVETNATTTHTAADANGLKITARNVTITGALDVDAKGCQGGTAAPGQDGYGPDSETGVCTLSATGAGSSNRGGAGHAGRGGYGWSDYTYGASYGSVTVPTLLGSGGGGGGNGGEIGGSGGGRIQMIVSGMLTLSGSIRADGADGSTPVTTNGSGGGSGGSIYLRAGGLDGAGSISASGGDGTKYGGGGGGGRIAVYYTALGGFNRENVSADGGIRGNVMADSSHGPKAGSAGAAFTLDRYTDDGSGSLFIGGGLELSDAFDTSRDDISFREGTRLTCAASDTITLSSISSLYLDNVVWDCENAVSRLNIWSGGSLYLTRTTSTFSGAIAYLDIAASSTLVTTSTLWAASGVDYARFSASTWTSSVSSTFIFSKAGASSTWDIANDLTLNSVQYIGAENAGSTYENGGVLSILNAIDLSLINSDILSSVSSTSLTGLTIDADSSIDASGRGCRGGIQGGANASGPNTSTGICAVSTSGYGLGSRSGGAHGGAGGRGALGTGGAAQTTTYGDSTNPLFFGSGGSAGGNAAEHGRNGGGKVYLRVRGPAVIHGSVKVEGGPSLPASVSAYGVGGGSGGSVFLQAGVISGSGYISANGSGEPYKSADDVSGGGGGGRIAVLYSGLSGFDPDTQITYAGGVAAPGHWYFGSGTSGGAGSLYTLQTNQAPNIPASLGQSSLVNGSTTGTTNPIFTFTLSDDDVADTVQYRIQIDDSSDFSSPVVDYTSALVAQGAATFQVGQAAGSGAYTVGSVSQTLSDGSYYWRVKTIDASAAESSYTTANSGSVAFIVDSATRTVSFAYSTMSSLESVTATSVRVVLDTTHFENVTVGYSVTGGTATGSGTDYTLSAGTATITAGETSTTIALVVVNDEIDEPDETFVITLASPTYAALGATDALTYTITDNDTAGITSSESAFSLSEGGASDTFTLVLTSKPTSTVTVAFTTSTAGITLVPASLAFTTDNWATPQTVTISATDDSRYESSHTTSVVMTVSGGVYGYPLVTPPTITATITDNETSDITISASTLAVTEGSFGILTFVLASQPTSTVTLVFTTPSESALSASSLTFTADNWSTPQTLTVNILNNRDYVGTRTATLTTTVTSDTTFSQVAVPTVTITINEDDAPPGGGAASVGPGAFYVPFPLDYVPPVTTEPVLPPQTGGEISPSAPGTESPTVPSVPASNQARTQISSDATSFRVTLAPQDQERLASFIDTGTTPATQALGSGERRALVRDALDTMGRAPTQADLERLAQGQIPQTRNLAREREQLPRARSTFRTIYGRDPNFQNAQENLAWNTLMYRIRFTRDLAEERQGITAFRQTFRRTPSDPFQWAVVRVLGYVR